jgi:hypothetical protein
MRGGEKPAENKQVMDAAAKPKLYRVLATDNALHGPIDLASLKAWVLSSRIDGKTWILCEERDQWHRAAELPELKSAFAEAPPARPTLSPSIGNKGMPGFASAALRRIELFSGWGDLQLEAFSEYLEALSCPQFSHLVRQGQRWEAMYFVLEGELRACIIVDGKETPQATLHVGDFFGQISLFDRGTHSVDVIANKDSILLRISSESFENLSREEPKLALHFAFALGRSVGKIGARRPGGESPGFCYAGEPAPIKPIPTHHLAAAKELPPCDKTRSFPKD